MLRITLVVCLLCPFACAQELITLRSGNGTAGGTDANITLLQGPFFAAFGVAEYASAAAGVPAEIIPSGSYGWAPTLSNDPLAQWISTSQAGTGPPSLYAMPFTVMTPAIGLATITINMHVDDFLGDAINVGISVNAMPIPSSSTTAGGTWVNEVGFTNLDVTAAALTGVNYLYLYVNNTGGPGGIQFSADINVYPPAGYQTNSLTAGLNIDGVIGTAYVPATTTLGIGAPGTLNLLSIAGGQQWDIGSGVAPLVATGGGAILTAGGQIVNLNLADPSFGFWFNFLQGPPYPATPLMSFPFSSPVAMSASAQMVVVNVATPSGVSLSQPVRLIVQ